MFTQIDVERAKNRLSIKKLAAASGMKYDTLLSKLNGHTEFTRKEMLSIQAAFSEKVPLEELFATDDDLKSA
jgi:transcriptional regulator with XRE-family HTH domain